MSIGWWRTSSTPALNILADDTHVLAPDSGTVVLLGEVLIRDTPADAERPERTRLVHVSAAGSEFNVAVGLARLGIASTFVSRLPDNPYGWAVRDTAVANGVCMDYTVWAPAVEPIGRLIYEIGRTPRRDVAVYQRMYSAASRLTPDMVDWKRALGSARLLHTTGITLGLASHSGYRHNHLRRAFIEAAESRPGSCLIGFDLNYRSSLWTVAQARRVLSPIVGDYVDVLATSIADVAAVFDYGCGRYSARQIAAGDFNRLDDDDVRGLEERLLKTLNLKTIGLAIRYPDSFEAHRWESAAMNTDGKFFRSIRLHHVNLSDRLGGGDAWVAGFYYGLLTGESGVEMIRRGVLVGDAASRLQQTLMFDLPILSKRDVHELLDQDETGGGKRTSR